MERFRSDSWELCRYRNQITLIRVLSVLGSYEKKKKGSGDWVGRCVAGGHGERRLKTDSTVFT